MHGVPPGFPRSQRGRAARAPARDPELAGRRAGRRAPCRASLHVSRLRRGPRVHQPRRRRGRGRRPSPGAVDRMGAGHRDVVDARDPWVAPQRFRHGRQDRRADPRVTRRNRHASGGPPASPPARGRQRGRDCRSEYDAGLLSFTARRLMDALVREPPQYRRGLRANTFMRDPGKTREFGGAMAELQQGLWIVKTEERYEPTFSYRWDLLEAWLPDAVAEGRRLGRPRAIERLIERFVGGAVFTNERVLARLFRLPMAEVTGALARLVRRGTLAADEAIDGWPGRWLVHTSARRG